MKTSMEHENRFESDASRYAAYLETPEGRLRTDLTSANLKDYLTETRELKSLRALDLGCGTGAASIRLARLGIHVTLIDSSPEMLKLAERAAQEAGVSHEVTFKHADVTRVPEALSSESFDVILCHNVLEYVEDPPAVLRGAVRVMRNSSAILSILVRNQAGEVLKTALRAGDLDAAEHNLAAEWGEESLYGGKVRLFTPVALEAMLQDASLAISARWGVRSISDYLPETISRSAAYDRILTLERKLGVREEFFGVARYMHCLAQRVALASEVDP